MKMDMVRETEKIIRYFPARWQESLRRMPNFVRYNLQEIRARKDCPIMFCTGKENLLLLKSGQVCRDAESADQRMDQEELTQVFEALCDYSVHSYQEELKNGFITLPGGHRVGVIGTFLSEKGKIIGVKEITSVNIRLAREVKGAADELFTVIGKDPIPSVLLVGAPSTGKTTMLRDFARQVSNGISGRLQKVALIDERGELAAGYRGLYGDGQADLGVSTDVYSFCPKAKGMEIALRTGSPDFIVCDELGGEEETQILLEALSSGVKTAVSVHGESLSDILRKKAVSTLIQAGVFQKIVFLENKGIPGKIRECVTVTEKEGEKRGAQLILGDSCDFALQFCRDLQELPLKTEDPIAFGKYSSVRKDENISSL